MSKLLKELQHTAKTAKAQKEQAERDKAERDKRNAIRVAITNILAKMRKEAKEGKTQTDYAISLDVKTEVIRHFEQEGLDVLSQGDNVLFSWAPPPTQGNGVA